MVDYRQCRRAYAMCSILSELRDNRGWSSARYCPVVGE